MAVVQRSKEVSFYQERKYRIIYRHSLFAPKSCEACLYMARLSEAKLWLRLAQLAPPAENDCSVRAHNRQPYLSSPGHISSSCCRPHVSQSYRDLETKDLSSGVTESRACSCPKTCPDSASQRSDSGEKGSRIRPRPQHKAPSHQRARRLHRCSSKFVVSRLSTYDSRIAHMCVRILMYRAPPAGPGGRGDASSSNASGWTRNAEVRRHACAAPFPGL